MKKLNVLFVYCPPIVMDEEYLSNSASSLRCFPPLGSMALVQTLYGQDYIDTLNFLDLQKYSAELNGNPNPDSIIEDILHEYAKDVSYDVICISVVFSSSHAFLKKLVQIIRSVFADCPIICGGMHPTSVTKTVFEDIEAIDYIVRGEGEITLPKLIESLASGSQCTDVDGIISRELFLENSSSDNDDWLTISELPLEFEVKFESYPALFDMEYYVNNSFLFTLTEDDGKAKCFPIMASRGCPVGCTYCSSKLVHGLKPRWRSIANVRDEMIFLNKTYGVTSFLLADDNFIPKSKAIELFDMIGKLPIDNLSAAIINMSVNHTDFDVLDSIIDAGIKYIPFAIETGSNEMQKKIKKFCNLDKAKELVKYAQQKGANVRCLYIIGFPGESLSQINETIAFAKEMDADYTSFFAAVPFPATEMYNEFLALGYIEDTPEFWGITSIRERMFDTEEYTGDELEHIVAELDFKFNFVNSPYIVKKNFKTGKAIYEKFVANYDFHIFAYDCLRRINIGLGDFEEAERILNIMKDKLRTNPKSKGFIKHFHLLDEETRALLSEFTE